MTDSPVIIHARSIRIHEALQRLASGETTLEEILSFVDEEESNANLAPEHQDFFDGVRKLARKIMEVN